MGRYLMLFFVVVGLFFDLFFINAYISCLLVPLLLWGWDDMWSLFLFFVLGCLVAFVLSLNLIVLMPMYAFVFALSKFYSRLTYMHFGWFMLYIVGYYICLSIIGVFPFNLFSLICYLLISVFYQRYILSLERSRLLKI